MPIFKQGDILDAKEDIIVHQCNCVTSGSLGLATDIFNKFPGANTYKTRKEPSRPGTIDAIQLYSDFDSNPVGPFYIVNMYAQYRPGKSSNEPRSKWFYEYLEQLVYKIDRGDGGQSAITVAVPNKIGCGLAGGNWNVYLQMLTDFEQRYPWIRLVIYTK